MKTFSPTSLAALFLLSTSLFTHNLQASSLNQDPEDKKNISKASSITISASTSLGDQAEIYELFSSHQHNPQIQETVLNLASLFDYDKLPVGVKRYHQSRADKPLLQIMEECEPQDRVNLLTLLKDIFLPLADSNDIEKALLRFDILDKLRELKAPRTERIQALFPLFLNVLNTFNEGQTVRKEVLHLFQVAKIHLDDYSPEQLGIIATHTVSLIEKLKPTKYFGYLLTTITDAVQISPRRLPEVIDLVTPILRGSCFENALYSTNIIPQLVLIEDNQNRQNIATYCILFNHSSAVAQIPMHIAQVDMSEREALVSLVQDLSSKFNDLTPPSSYNTTDIDLITILTSLPESKRFLVHKRFLEILKQEGLKEPFYKGTSLYASKLLTQGEVLATISEENWHDILPNCISLLRHGMHLHQATNALIKLPSQLREEGVRRYITLLNHGNFDSLLLLDSDLFSTIAGTSTETWQDIEPYAHQFVTQYNDHLGLVPTLEILSSISEDKAEVFQSLLALCEHSESIRIHELITPLPADEIKMLPSVIKEWFEDANQALTGTRTPPGGQLKNHRMIVHKQDLVKMFLNLPTTFRSVFLNVATKVLPRTQNISVYRLLSLPLSILSQAAHFSQQEETLPKAIMCLNNFYKVSSSLSPQEMDVLFKSAPYLSLKLPGIEMPLDPSQKSYVATVLKDILQAIIPIQPTIKNNILSLYAPYFSPQQFGQGKFFQTLSQIPQDQLSSCLKETQAHLKDNSDGFLWADILQTNFLMSNYLEQASSNYDLGYVQGIKNKYISFLSSISSPLNFVSNLMATYEEKCAQNQQRLVFMGVFESLPLPTLEQSIDKLQRAQQSFNTPQEVINFLRTENIIDIPTLTNSWAEALRTNPNQFRVSLLVNYITQQFTLFNLTEEDDVVQEAIRAGITLSTADQPLNPYNIFKKLEEKRAEAVNWEAIRPTVETFGKTRVHYNPEFFKDDLPQHVITFSELPNYSSTFLRESITAMDARVLAEPHIAAKIKEMSTLDYETLKANSLQGNVLESLLSKTGKPHEKVPVVVARLIAIVSYLETLSHDRGENTFSEKEEGFLRMLASIQACSVGIQEGIHAYYLNIIPSEYRYSRLQSQNDGDMDYLRSKQEAITILSEEIDKMFSGDNYFIKQLVGVDSKEQVMQSSHQGQYLKNLIGHSLGLPGQLLFDAHTHTLYVKLVQLSKQEALVTFFKYFVPHTFLDLTCILWDLEQYEAIDSLIDMGIFKKVEPVAAPSHKKPKLRA